MNSLLHATCVSLDRGGVLLRGPSGSGKSDLALQLIDRGARLVADDYVALSAAEGKLVAAVPSTIKGLLEIRGVGIVEVPAVTSCVVSLLVDLVEADQVERLPEPGTETVNGIALKRIALFAREASAAAKIRMALAGHLPLQGAAS
jgi:serine kinase of HPr protein (carbohydrate metabolism regulator)